MAACLMILLYVRYEMSYDKWIPDSERVYQIQSWYKSSETGEEAQLQMTPYASGAALAKDFPQVESQVYLFNNNPVFLKDGERSEEHTSELQSLMRISYAVFCLKKKNKTTTNSIHLTYLTNKQHTYRIT